MLQSAQIPCLPRLCKQNAFGLERSVSGGSINQPGAAEQDDSSLDLEAITTIERKIESTARVSCGARAGTGRDGRGARLRMQSLYAWIVSSHSTSPSADSRKQVSRVDLASVQMQHLRERESLGRQPLPRPSSALPRKREARVERGLD